ncbi:MAG: hypothetical protein RL030_2752 [Pseudomonadota bacterium]|jgi:hypothetical protein
MSSVSTSTVAPSGTEQIAALLSTDPAGVAIAAVNAAPQQRTVGQQLLVAQTPSQVRRILPRPMSAAESIALFHLGT